VIPTLVTFLLRYDFPSLQFEAAWCITNIACGESHHIQHLLIGNVIENFTKVIQKCNETQLLQQSLWAICNLSNDEAACKMILEKLELILLTLFQIGIECLPQDLQLQEITWNNLQLLQESVSKWSPRHIPVNDFPSLATMRHVTFIIGNILK
jgi:hypothetical protein